jgi:hypothetical protein
MTELALTTPSTTTSERAPAALIAWAEAAHAANQLAKPLCQTDFVPASFRGKEHDATAAILMGAEVGLSPLQALQGIFVISGRPAMYARTMLAITLAAGHEVYVEESTDSRAIVCGRRKGSQHLERVVITIDQARKAGWTKNSKYNSEPAAMLLARGQSQVCRRIAPDALAGVAYSAEEAEDENPPTVTVTARADTPKRTARRATPPPTPEPPLDEAQTTPEPDPEPEPDADLITPAQLRKLHVVLGEQGLNQRDDALSYLSTYTGREITTSKALTKREASEIIDALEPQQPEPEL